MKLRNWSSICEIPDLFAMGITTGVSKAETGIYESGEIDGLD